MKRTVYFTLLITNIINAALPALPSYEDFRDSCRWDAYNPETSDVTCYYSWNPHNPNNQNNPYTRTSDVTRCYSWNPYSPNTSDVTCYYSWNPHNPCTDNNTCYYNCIPNNPDNQNKYTRTSDVTRCYSWNPYSPDTRNVRRYQNVREPSKPIAPRSLPTAIIPPSEPAEELKLLEAPPSPDSVTSSPAITVSPDRQLSTTSGDLRAIIQLLKSYKTTSEESQQTHPAQLLIIFEQLSTSTRSLSSEMFKKIQDFLNSEYHRLRKFISTTNDQLSALQTQYDQLLKLLNVITMLKHFSIDQRQKLLCYHVSMLIGASNVAGMRTDNSLKEDYLIQALSIIEMIGRNVINPYGSGQNFILKTMKDLCEQKLEVSRSFMKRDAARK